MKSEQLLNALNDIDDSMIEESCPFDPEEITKPVLLVNGGTGKGSCGISTCWRSREKCERAFF